MALHDVSGTIDTGGRGNALDYTLVLIHRSDLKITENAVHWLASCFLHNRLWRAREKGTDGD
ncbi:hypothetical protein IL54_2563 [Sphingobium sp. ba1]|nr:hypothetical protein IL54_2563 [Sphingobium sp. ba1]